MTTDRELSRSWREDSGWQAEHQPGQRLGEGDTGDLRGAPGQERGQQRQRAGPHAVTDPDTMTAVQSRTNMAPSGGLPGVRSGSPLPRRTLPAFRCRTVADMCGRPVPSRAGRAAVSPETTAASARQFC